MDFTAPYAEIEATYLVPPGSTIQSIDEVDRPGNRISVSKGSAYGLWLENNIKQAELSPEFVLIGLLEQDDSAECAGIADPDRADSTGEQK